MNVKKPKRLKNKYKNYLRKNLNYSYKLIKTKKILVNPSKTILNQNPSSHILLKTKVKKYHLLSFNLKSLQIKRNKCPWKKEYLQH